MYLLGAGVVRCTWVRAVGLARAVPRAGRRELHPARGRGLVGPSRAVGELPLPRHWVARPGRARGLGALADEDALERVAGTVVEEERLLGAVEVEGVLLEARLGQLAVLGAQAVLIWQARTRAVSGRKKERTGQQGSCRGGKERLSSEWSNAQPPPWLYVMAQPTSTLEPARKLCKSLL